MEIDKYRSDVVSWFQSTPMGDSASLHSHPYWGIDCDWSAMLDFTKGKLTVFTEISGCKEIHHLDLDADEFDEWLDCESLQSLGFRINVHIPEDQSEFDSGNGVCVTLYCFENSGELDYAILNPVSDIIGSYRDYYSYKNMLDLWNEQFEASPC